MVSGLREGMAAGWSLGALLQLGLEGLDEFVLLLQLFTQSTKASQTKEINNICLCNCVKYIECIEVSFKALSMLPYFLKP